MNIIIKVIGKNEYNQFGIAIRTASPSLVDGGINKISKKITEITSRLEFAIYILVDQQ